MTFREQVAYRAKAVLAGVGLAVMGFLSWLVQNPDTARVVEQFVPAPYAQLVPLLLAGVAATLLVNRVPNAPRPFPTVPAETVEPPTETTIVRVSGQNGGEYLGEPAH